MLINNLHLLLLYFSTFPNSLISFSFCLLLYSHQLFLLLFVQGHQTSWRRLLIISEFKNPFEDKRIFSGMYLIPLF